jgi:hypothetical protein
LIDQTPSGTATFAACAKSALARRGKFRRQRFAFRTQNLYKLNQKLHPKCKTIIMVF